VRLHGRTAATVAVCPARDVWLGARVGHCHVRGTVYIEDGKRARRRTASYPAGNTAHSREDVRCLASHVLGHDGSVRDAGDVHTLLVDARVTLDIADDSFEKSDIVVRGGAAREDASRVPAIETCRVGNDEPVLVGYRIHLRPATNQ